MKRRTAEATDYRPYLPALVGFLFPVFFIPTIVDSYVLPRVALLLVAVATGLLLARPAGLAAALRGIALPAAAVVFAAVLAGAVSVSPWASLAGQYLRYESVVVRIAYLLLFLATAALLAGPGEAAARARRRTVSWFLFGCAIAALEGLYEWIAYSAGWPGGLDRPDGNLGNAGLLGAVEAMAVVLGLARALEPGGTAWRLLLPILVVGLAVSTERSAWVAALVGAVVVAAARVPARRRAVFAGGALAAAAVLLAVVLGPLAAIHSDPVTGRLDEWRLVLPMLEARPILGWGEETFGLVFGHFAGQYLPGVTFDRAHSQLLDLVQAQGLVGLAAGTWFWATFAWRAFRRTAVAEVLHVLGALAAYWTWVALNFDWAPATGPMWLLAGVAWSATAGESEPRRWVRPAQWLTAAAAAVGAVVLGVLPLAADAAYHSGDPQLAVQLAPLQSRYHHVLGGQLAQSGQLVQAAAELRRAGELGDDEAGVWVELSAVDARLGRQRDAQVDLARARQIDPRIHVEGGSR